MSKVIILAAGRGSRLSPLTDDRPKCMVEYQNKALINYQLEALSTLDINIICGYKDEVLKSYLKERFTSQNITFFNNPNWNNSNMVYSLFCARKRIEEIANAGDNLIISYSDLVYFKDCIDRLEQSDESGIIVFKEWQKLWEKRFNNILDDAESLIIDKGYILELGKKVNTLAQIQGQYIGLIKLSSKDLLKMIAIYDALDRKKIYDGKDFNNMYMTSFINEMIAGGIAFKALEYGGILGEIDSKKDLSIDIFK